MIPNVFHFVFGLREQDEPFHLMHYLCLASCLEVNKPDAVFLHYRHEPYGEWWERIRPRLQLRRIEPERFIAEYRYDDPAVARFRYAHLADFARLRVLLEEGGIYADIDTLFLKPVPEQWRRYPFILGRERPPKAASGGGSLCNAWIASAPGSEFGRRWLEGMAAAFDGSWSAHSTLLPWHLSVDHPELLHVEPETTFYALDWTPGGIHDLFGRSVRLPEGACSLHLWQHLWWSPSRTDFSAFHAGLLTADYVAWADTTYARHARSFLPVDVRHSRSRYWRQRLGAAVLHPVRDATAWMRRLGRRS